MNPTPTSFGLGIHLRDGDLKGEVDHQEHKHSNGLYPVVGLEFGTLSVSLYPGRERAVELAAILEGMAAELRAGAERFAVNALQD